MTQAGIKPVGVTGWDAGKGKLSVYGVAWNGIEVLESHWDSCGLGSGCVTCATGDVVLREALSQASRPMVLTINGAISRIGAYKGDEKVWAPVFLLSFRSIRTPGSPLHTQAQETSHINSAVVCRCPGHISRLPKYETPHPQRKPPLPENRACNRAADPLDSAPRVLCANQDGPNEDHAPASGLFAYTAAYSATQLT